jgi:carotenoid 1,2-hydratase
VPPNGYAWWYLDAVSDDRANALTIIFFIGSVFSPYYARARRRGSADPTEHCAVNVALYGPRRHLWSMTERSRDSLRRSPMELAIGPSRLAVNGHGIFLELDELPFRFCNAFGEG